MSQNIIKTSNEIVLIRGLPGSGKSTRAKEMLNHVHLEADMFFDVGGKYVYDSSKIKDAHNWCIESAKTHLECGRNVVVSNGVLQFRRESRTGKYPAL